VDPIPSDSLDGGISIRRSDRKIDRSPTYQIMERCVQHCGYVTPENEYENLANCIATVCREEIENLKIQERNY